MFMSTAEVIGLCVLNLFSVLTGIKIGSQIARGREITFNPVKAVKNEIKAIQEDKKESLRKRQLDTNLSNINNYNGSGLGQKQIPRE
jgi:hypothetical protein